MTPVLSEQTFVLFAMHVYDNAQCVSIKEFEEDLMRFMYLNKLFKRYHTKGELKTRLILNHIVILTNVFGMDAVDMLFLKVPKEYWSYLVVFLVYLNLLPDMTPHLKIDTSLIQLDMTIAKELREL